MSPRKSKVNTSRQQTTTINGRDLPQFVSCELTDDEKAKIKENLFSAEEVIDFMEAMQNEGYRIAVSHDARSNCVGIYITATDPQHENYGLALSARSPSFVGVVTVAAFKHYDKLGEDWRAASQSIPRDSWG